MVQLLFQELHIVLCCFGKLVPAGTAGNILLPAGQHGDHRLHTVQVGQRVEGGDLHAVQLVTGDDRDLFQAAEHVQLGQGDLVGTLHGKAIAAGHTVKGAHPARAAGGGAVLAACLAQLLVPHFAHMRVTKSQVSERFMIL